MFKESFMLYACCVVTILITTSIKTKSHYVVFVCIFAYVELMCREADVTKERIEKLLKDGANVVLTTKGIDDMALKASVYGYLILLCIYDMASIHFICGY